MTMAYDTFRMDHSSLPWSAGKFIYCSIMKLYKLFKKITDSLIYCCRESIGLDNNQYLRLWKYSVLIIIVIAHTPLVMIAFIDHYHNNVYMKKLNDLTAQLISKETSYIKHSGESFLKKHLSLLKFISARNTYEEILNVQNFNGIFNDLKNISPDFTALELLSSKGELLARAGNLSDREKVSYGTQKWFYEVNKKGVYISDVSGDLSLSPRFTISVKSEQKQRGDYYILNAEIKTRKFHELTHPAAAPDKSEALIVNHNGVPQTSLYSWSKNFAHSPVKALISSKSSETVVERLKLKGHPVIAGYAHIPQSPFTALVIQKEQKNAIRSWYFLEQKWLILSFFGMIFVFKLAGGISTSLIKRIRKADIDRIALLQKVELEHTHRLASLGRLSSGIAHEINNPLAIIQEKAGLIEDIILCPEDVPHDEEHMNEFGELIGSIQKAVIRCSTITHRLLGFARQGDVIIETVDLNEIIKDILSFLEREARHRDIRVNHNLTKNHILIESDKGQLQQVFLNLINNAFDAVNNGGQINIFVKDKVNLEGSDDDTRSLSSKGIKVTVSDSGKGIAEEYIDHIFEPFFSEKREKGVGLGLSITYGIVKKLGGDIHVESKVGRGTTFIVTLPSKR